MLAGAGVLLYPEASQWVSQYNQSNILYTQTQIDTANGRADAAERLALAKEYNRNLSGGAQLDAGANIAEASHPRGDGDDYRSMLRGDPTGIMARLRVPSIDLDLPVFHGTSDQTLLKGVGHLEGTALPVGGVGTRSVLTGHRGLATAALFTHLDQVRKGDLFSIEVLGEVFAYRVTDTVVVAPDDTKKIAPVAGQDLVTLVTCTPLGINTHRILVTGERVVPVPEDLLELAGARPDVPHFPWWVVTAAVALALIAIWYWRSGYPSRMRRVSSLDVSA